MRQTSASSSGHLAPLLCALIMWSGYGCDGEETASPAPVDATASDAAFDLSMADAGADAAPDADVIDADLTDAEPPCVPGETARCPGLEVGRCKPGIRTCGEDGRFGPCEGVIPPATFEACNGEDDDCDGVTDEGASILQPLCDTGLQGRCGAGVARECVEGVPLCRPLYSPIAEQCNGIDDDCDGAIDEGAQGGILSRICYEGPPGTESLGPCLTGTQVCEAGAWGTCDGQRLPEVELCNGIDDDCDGRIDDGNPEAGGQCDSGEPGRCGAGQLTCVSGGLQCVRQIAPIAELCNGIDDDCDGAADEGNPGAGACFTGALGRCGQGALTCDGGALRCDAVSAPQAERCDGVDDDCDGRIDEGIAGIGGLCETGAAGLCAEGRLQCQGAGGLVCVPQQQNRAEQCNAVDDDCDGQIDEGLPGVGQACVTGRPGVCGAGQTICDGNGAGLTCNQVVQAGDERCDGVDNDCDGQIDEGNPGGGAACQTGASGQCQQGQRLCVAGSLTCQGITSASEELCDGVDNDCDGISDEGNPEGGEACQTDLLGPCQEGQQICTGGALQCRSATQPGAEICDGVDNDCDGASDEDYGLLGADCAVGRGECAAFGSYVCDPTGVVEICGAQPGASSPELCNQLDDDCDGRVDEGRPESDVECSTGQRGVCAVGLTVCEIGALTCEIIVPPSEEICDALDNDCDGTSDEVPSVEIGPLRISPEGGRGVAPTLAQLEHEEGPRLGLAWVDNRLFNDAVYFSIRDPEDGAVLVSDLRVSVGARDPSQLSMVAAHGGFALAWADERERNPEIYFIRITAEGQIPTIETRITTNVSRSQRPQLLATEEGYLIIWEDNPTNVTGLYAQRLDLNGQPVGDVIRLTGEAVAAETPSVAPIPGGGYALAWAQRRGVNSDIYFMKLQADGQPAAAPVQLTDEESRKINPDLIADEAGFLVIWRGGNVLITQRLDGEGQIAGPSQQITVQGADAQRPALVAGNDEQDAGMLWTAAVGELGRRALFRRIDPVSGTHVGPQIDLGPAGESERAPPVQILVGRRYAMMWASVPEDRVIHINFARGPMGCP